MVEDSYAGDNGVGRGVAKGVGKDMQHFDLRWRLGRIPWLCMID
jgi:hypothetical protein